LHRVTRIGHEVQPNRQLARVFVDVPPDWAAARAPGPVLHPTSEHCQYIAPRPRPRKDSGIRHIFPKLRT